MSRPPADSAHPARPGLAALPAVAPVAVAPATVRRAKVAVSLVFGANGLAMASWLSRVPEVQRLLDLTAGRLGLLLLCLSVGAVAMLPLSGAVVRRIGPGATVAAGGVVVAVALLLVGVGAQVLGAAPLAGLGLLLIGAGSASWDVAMNVEGAAVEGHLGRTVMPRFHAAFSIGTVVGAVAGFGASLAGVPVLVHLGAAALVIGAVAVAGARSFLPSDPAAVAASASHGSVLAAWRERRTLLLGLLVLCAAFVEGVANDWLAVALRDGYDVEAPVGVLGFALFVTAMTAGRLGGGPALDRLGRVPVLAAGFGLVLAGVLVVVLSPVLWLAMVGALLWGVGSAMGFPVGISAAADGGNAEARVSVVATIGYTAFLAGPPLLGFLGDEVGVRTALVVVAAVAVPGLLLARSARPLAP